MQRSIRPHRVLTQRCTWVTLARVTGSHVRVELPDDGRLLTLDGLSTAGGAASMDWVVVFPENPEEGAKAGAIWRSGGKLARPCCRMALVVDACAANRVLEAAVKTQWNSSTIRK